jgi:hypothetical protein
MFFRLSQEQVGDRSRNTPVSILERVNGDKPKVGDASL